jgi:hypothetical protein
MPVKYPKLSTIAAGRGVSVALTYVGSLAFPDASDSNAWERLAAIPMMVTVYLFAPTANTSKIEVLVIEWAGSVVICFAIGTAILIGIEKWIKKRREKKQVTNRI